MKKHMLAVVVMLMVLFTAEAEAGPYAADLDGNAYEYSGLETTINRIVENEEGIYGVFVIDLKSGKSMGINPLEQFHAASTFKLPLNIYLYEKVDRGEADLLKRLVYEKRHYEGGTGILQNSPFGSSFEMGLLSRYSIIYSDNVATNMLLSYLGRKNVKDRMRSMGGLVVEDDRNITCPRDMALYMLHLLNFAADHPEQGNLLIGYLENTVFNDRIPAPLPGEVVVAHKIGNWPATGTYNDVGYVMHPKNPYIISVFSRGTPGQSAAFSVIRKISGAVYDYQDSFVPTSLRLNGKPLETAGVSPVYDGGVVLAPVREVAVALGASVEWDAPTGSTLITRGNEKIMLRIGSGSAVVNNGTVNLAKPVRFTNNRVMAPVRFISEALGATVSWDDASRTVNIKYVPVEKAAGPGDGVTKRESAAAAAGDDVVSPANEP
ncbi:MAG: serine hydrolase [Bacillota bacterium]